MTLGEGKLASREELAPDELPAAAPHAMTKGIIRLGHFFFRRRNSLFPLVFLAVMFLSRPRLPLGSESGDAWMDAAGIALALLGQGLRVLVIGLAYIRRGGREGAIYADDLVQGGFFAHSRNPLYLGNVMIFLGLLVVLHSTAGYLIGVPFFVFAYFAIVLAEEDYLRKRFGRTYEEYCRRVNRFFPSLRGLRNTLQGMEFNWPRVIRKEYGSTFSWITALLGLLVWERASRLGFRAAEPSLRAALLAWIPAILGYLTARFLKKTGRLGST